MALKLLVNPSQFLQQLSGFKKLIDDNKIPKSNFKYYESKLHANYEFTPENIAVQSMDAARLCNWIHNIIKYYKVIRSLQPKKKSLALIEIELIAVNKKLRFKRDEEKYDSTGNDELKVIYDESVMVRKPFLDNAEEAINALSKHFITELKRIKNPPEHCKIVNFAVSILLGQTSITTWVECQKMMADPRDFIQQCHQFLKDGVENIMPE